MGNRLGPIAGLVLFAMVLGRLDRLFTSGDQTMPWQVILIAALLLGMTSRWLLSQTRIPPGLASFLVVTGAFLVLLRVAVPATLNGGVLPGPETLSALLEELETAFWIFRSGVPPVTPTPGVIGALATLLWMLGSVFTIGAVSDRLGLMVLPAGIFYLQLAVLDRTPAGLAWYGATALVVTLASSSLAMRHGVMTGRTRGPDGHPRPMRSMPAALAMAACVGVVSVLGTAQAAPVISEYGNLPWRDSSGAQGFGGGVAFDRFIELRQRLHSRQNAVVFRAAFGAGSPPPDSIYWRMETLDAFDGTGWRRSSGQMRAYSPGAIIGDPQHRYAGTTQEVLQRVVVEQLIGQVVPTAGQPTSIFDLDTPGSMAPNLVSFARDGSISFPPGLSSGLSYQIAADYPNLATDLGSLATGPDGNLSPLFSAAAAAGLFPALPDPARPDLARPSDLSNYLALPQGLPLSLNTIARIRTAGAATSFEQAWMLQHWFRDSGDFTYSLNVTTGSQALNLSDWLSVPSSTNYRTGYCEQFAASMAILARTLGIPSRVVWGFAPGTSSVVDEVSIVEVRDTNAHAWVELWIDGFGWVMFDPTPRAGFLPPSPTAVFDPDEFVVPPTDPSIQDPVDPDQPPPVFEDEPPVGGGGAIDFDGAAGAIVPVLLAALGLTVILVLLSKRARRERRMRRLTDGDVTAAWEEIVDRLVDMGGRLDSSLTPTELTGATVPELRPLAVSYSAAIYGGKTGLGKPEDLTRAEEWIELSYDRRQLLLGAINPRSLFRR